MYHSIERSNLHKDRMGMAVPTDIFQMQMEYLKDNGFYVIRLLDLADKIRKDLPIPERSVAITFDDGYKSILTGAAPILKKQGFPATLFVNVHFIERRLPPDAYWRDWQTLSWDEVKELPACGISIGAHGMTHRRLSGLSYDDMSSEILRSRDIIRNNINRKVFEFSYPHGAFNKKAVEVLRNNDFTCACSSLHGINGRDADLFALKRTEITTFDNTSVKFEKKIFGCYDWLSMVRESHD